ncbi:hypothetical protein [Staphylococcus phage LY01]|nr:hypothetical protein [Staphylococcus phage LY01]
MAKQSDVFSKNLNLYRKNGRKIPAKLRKMDDNGTWFYRFDQNRFIIDNIIRFNEDKELVDLLKEYRKSNKNNFNNDCYFFTLEKDIPKLFEHQLAILLNEIGRNHIGKDFLKDITLKDNSKLKIKNAGELEVWARDPHKTKDKYDPDSLNLDMYNMLAYIDYERNLIIINMIEDVNPITFNVITKSLYSINDEDINYNEETNEIQIKLNEKNLSKVLYRCTSKTFRIVLPFNYNYESFDEEHSIVLDKFSKTYIKQLEKEEYEKRLSIGGQPYHLKPENRPYYAKRRVINDWNIYEVFDENKDGYRLFSVKDNMGFIYLVYYIGKEYHGKGIITNTKETPGLQDPSNYRRSVKLKDIYYSVLMTQDKYNLMKKNKFDLYDALNTTNPKYMTLVDEENIHSTDFLDSTKPFKIRQTKFHEDKIKELKNRFIEDYDKGEF